MSLDAAREKAQIFAMASVIKTTTTEPCEKCGAAMVLVRIRPAADDPKSELHDFRCEICGATTTHRFKARPQD
jgi:hypothetical protein